uniref:SAP domain-containing protein n=1 Tax=Plectus sambesii TaxID=2011161 RepID=A0A914UNH3_9BILA
MNAVELEKLTVVQLREQLKARGLATAGNKPALVQRLIESFTSEEKILQSGSISSEDAGLLPQRTHPFRMCEDNSILPAFFV